MDWNKNNPRFKKSPLVGSRKRKSGRLLSSVSNKIGNLLNGLKKNDPEHSGEATALHRPQPPVPADLFEDLKIAVPKSRKFPGSRNPRRRRLLSEAVCSSPGGGRDQPDVIERPWSVDENQPVQAEALEVEGSGPLESEPEKKAPDREEKPFSVGNNLKNPANPDAPEKAEEAQPHQPSDHAKAATKNGTDRADSKPVAGTSAGSEVESVSETPKPVQPASNSDTKGPVGQSPAAAARSAARPKAGSQGRRPKSKPVPSFSPAAEGTDSGQTASLGRFVEASPGSLAGSVVPPSPADKSGDESIAKTPSPAGRGQRSKGGRAQECGSGPDITVHQPSLARDARPIEVFSPLGDKRKKFSGRPPRNLKRWSIAAAATLAVVGAVVAGIYFFQDSAPPSAKVARIPASSLPKVTPVAPGFYELYARELENAIQSEVTIAAGSSLGKALESVGIGPRHNVGAIIECLTSEGGVAIVRPGAVIKAFWGDQGKNELKRLEYFPSNGGAPMVVMARPDGGFWRYNLSSPMLTINAAKEGTISTSLWEAGSKAGLDANVIMSLADILASDVDFLTGIKEGDQFQVLYSRDYADGRPQGSPIIDMVTFKSKTKEVEYYRYVNSKDQVGFYDTEGRSSAKTFFASPLVYKRISSYFSKARKHPILKVVRAHEGVDYAAPSGTPVSSVADGTVIFCGRSGGYGNLVTIQHDATYTTMYGHLSKFAPGLKKGSIVKQGDLIGNVGATGLATGPHLDFRLKKNGKFIDPIPELAKQEGKKLESPEDRQAFVQVRDRIRERMRQQLAAAKTGV